MSTRIMVYACAALLASGLLAAEPMAIPFDEAHWDLAGASVVQHLDRTAVMGTAVLKDFELASGAIEVDMAVTGARSYPGVLFRTQPDGSWERVYVRPHRSGRVPPSLYPDVLQYVPSWNRVDSWQLYSGPGYTAGAVIPVERWFHVRIEVAGDRGRVFLDGSPEPTLEIPHLRHGVRKGGITLLGPADGSAYFSGFSVTRDAVPDLGPAPRHDVAPGFIRAWQVSQVLPALSIDDSGVAPPAEAGTLAWREVQADENGLVDVARVQGRTGQPDTVFLKTKIVAERAGVRPYKLGYSDAVSLYLNGAKVFSGDSSYQGRDPSFLGIVGLNDTVCLPLKAGENELVAMLSEISGGWGLEMQDAEAEYRAAGGTRLWKTGKVFATPESVAWDPVRQVLYVSNYDPFHPSREEGRQVIHRIGLDGGEPEVLARGLRNPTGLVVKGDSLYAVEARAVVEIALPGGAITRRIPVPDAAQLNDIDADASGALYVSDSQGGAIYRIAEGKADVVLRGAEVSRPNGVCVSGGRLVWANNGDATLKSVDLGSKQVTRLAVMEDGSMDGVSNGPDGSWLVSHNGGRLSRVRPDGNVTVVLDLTVPGTSIADFAYIPGKNLVVLPTFFDNRVVAERLGTAR
jgi:sugar lactone lactonase YvrE